MGGRRAQDMRTATTFQLPKRQIIPLLTVGQDPLRIFAKLPKAEDEIAISILTKYTEEIMKDLQVSEEQVAVALGPHPTLTSWLIAPPPPPPQDAITRVESKWFSKENFSMVSLKVQQGQLAPCQAVAEVYLGKQHRTHNKLTAFWATLYFHVAQNMDSFQQRPLVQYSSNNVLHKG